MVETILTLKIKGKAKFIKEKGDQWWYIII